MRIALYAVLLTTFVLVAWFSVSQPGPPEPSPSTDPAGELMGWGAVIAVVAVAGILYWRWRRQGDETREIAVAHGLTFTRLLASDRREPFMLFPTVMRGVLLRHVIEGRWRDREVALFDMSPYRRSRSQWTYALLPLPGSWPDVRVRTGTDGRRAADRAFTATTVAVPVLSGASVPVMTDEPEAAARVVGPETALVVAARPVRLEIDAEHLLYTEMEKVAATDVPAFLDRVAVLVDALLADRARPTP
jgi:hypothetical protein